MCCAMIRSTNNRFDSPKLKELIPKKILSTKKDKEWEKDVYKQHSTHKGMRPLFAKLEYLQILRPNFRASASIVAINKAEQQKVLRHVY